MIGLIGKKVGMSQVFGEDGRLTPVTVIEVEPNIVVGKRTQEKDGYSAVVLGAFDQKESRVAKPVLGQYPEGVSPKRCVREFRDFAPDCIVGESVSLAVLENVGFVDVVGVSKGKGFQGVMKRHNFGGGRATHGSKFHRENGSTGMAAWPSRVIKGTKMAGRMGGERSTSQSLRVVRVDAEKGMLLVKGAVPGTRNSYVFISNAKKK